MARRGENIYKRKDGRWEARYISGRKLDGSAHYKSLYGKTYQEVKKKLDAARSETAAQKKGGSHLTIAYLCMQ